MPIAAMVVLLGGLAALIGAFLLYQSGGFSGLDGGNAPVAATPGVPPDPGAQPPASADATTPPAAAPVAPTPGTASPAAAAATEPPAGAPAAVVAQKAAPPPPPPFEKTYECRKYAAFKVEPDTAIVTVNGEIIGIADEWADTPRTKKYEFEKKGVHYVKLSHRDYKTVWLRFIVSDEADDKTVEVELEMKKADKDEKDEKKKDEL